MCIALPGRVLAVDADGATVDLDGRRRRASTLLLPEVSPGDWVVVAAGTIVERLDPDDAKDIQALLLEARALEEADRGRSRTEASA